jgi:hypothetical protein
MFSPSLVSMIFQTLLRDRGDENPLREDINRSLDVGREVSQLLNLLAGTDVPIHWSSLPVVGRTSLTLNFGQLEKWVRTDSVGGISYFWGRVPVNLLANLISDFHPCDPEEYYLDIGTTLEVDASTSQLDTDCDTYLQRAASKTTYATCGAAIVDLGVTGNNPPNAYGGQLQHAVTTGVDLSDHAKKVLLVLLQRLDKNHLLADTLVSCALVKPPAHLIKAGNGCFDQANAVEMLDAVKALEAKLNTDNLPAAVNISLGTHVGPHNGDSPLEEYIATKLVVPKNRFVVVAAGNDGGSGLGAKRELAPKSRDFVTVRTGPRCKDLLVEFWWYDSQNGTMSIEATVYEHSKTIGKKRHGAVKIDSKSAGTALTNVFAGLPGTLAAQSLFHSKCRNCLSCIAFSISGTPGPMPLLDIEFALESTVKVMVNSWIVVCELRPQTTFLEGGPDGTIRVPASDKSVLSVAGAESTGQLWANSSRGPAAEYGSGSVLSAPFMAHLVSNGLESGTSFSSPRACGDVLKAIADPAKLGLCNDATDLLCEAYGLNSANLQWNRRSGYHTMKS